MFNRELLACAQHTLQKRALAVKKEAFVPAGGGGGAPPMDPAMMGGGGMPMDPAMMGGGGGMPMDPAMMGGAPPMDPAMMGGGGGGGMGMAPPPPASGDPAQLQSMIEQAVQKAMGGGGQAGAAAGGAPGGPAAAAFKVKPEQIYQEAVRNRKLLTILLNHLNITLPPDILNDPVMTNDASALNLSPQAMQNTSGSGQEQQSAIPPMEPMQGAFPGGGGGSGGGGGGGGGGEKQGSVTDRAHALTQLLGAIGRK